MMELAFQQVDVFTAEPMLGNPVAVVAGADGLTDARMAAFARWTNLSETAFLLRARLEGADYRLRIFTPAGEIPFAGHPTLGSCHAWLAAGGAPRGTDVIQECGSGLVRVRRDRTRLAFAAPPLLRSGPLEADLLSRLARGLGVPADSVVASQWVDNGPGWAAVLLGSRAAVLALKPDLAALDDLAFGVAGPFDASIDGTDAHFEVRAFAPRHGIKEDPVTGSLNAGLAPWLIRAGRAPTSYTASQGTVLGRVGRVFLDQLGETLWIGGDSVTCITGTVTL